MMKQHDFLSYSNFLFHLFYGKGYPVIHLIPALPQHGFHASKFINLSIIYYFISRLLLAIKMLFW